MNRESEDLPEWLLETIARTASNPVFISLWINRAIPDRFFDPGFFLSRLQTRPSFAIDFALHRREEPHAKECSNTPHRFQVSPKNGTFLHPVGPSLSQALDRLLLLFPFMLPPWWPFFSVTDPSVHRTSSASVLQGTLDTIRLPQFPTSRKVSLSRTKESGNHRISFAIGSRHFVPLVCRRKTAQHLYFGTVLTT